MGKCSSKERKGRKLVSGKGGHQSSKASHASPQASATAQAAAQAPTQPVPVQSKAKAKAARSQPVAESPRVEETIEVISPRSPAEQDNSFQDKMQASTSSTAVTGLRKRNVGNKKETHPSSIFSNDGGSERYDDAQEDLPDFPVLDSEGHSFDESEFRTPVGRLSYDAGHYLEKSASAPDRGWGVRSDISFSSLQTEPSTSATIQKQSFDTLKTQPVVEKQHQDPKVSGRQSIEIEENVQISQEKVAQTEASPTFLAADNWEIVRQESLMSGLEDSKRTDTPAYETTEATSSEENGDKVEAQDSVQHHALDYSSPTVLATSKQEKLLHEALGGPAEEEPIQESTSKTPSESFENIEDSEAYFSEDETHYQKSDSSYVLLKSGKSVPSSESSDGYEASESSNTRSFEADISHLQLLPPENESLIQVHQETGTALVAELIVPKEGSKEAEIPTEKGSPVTSQKSEFPVEQVVHDEPVQLPRRGMGEAQVVLASAELNQHEEAFAQLAEKEYVIRQEPVITSQIQPPSVAEALGAPKLLEDEATQLMQVEVVRELNVEVTAPTKPQVKDETKLASKEAMADIDTFVLLEGSLHAKEVTARHPGYSTPQRKDGGQISGDTTVVGAWHMVSVVEQPVAISETLAEAQTTEKQTISATDALTDTQKMEDDFTERSRADTTRELQMERASTPDRTISDKDKIQVSDDEITITKDPVVILEEVPPTACGAEYKAMEKTTELTEENVMEETQTEFVPEDVVLKKENEERLVAEDTTNSKEPEIRLVEQPPSATAPLVELQATDDETTLRKAVSQTTTKVAHNLKEVEELPPGAETIAEQTDDKSTQFSTHKVNEETNVETTPAETILQKEITTKLDTVNSQEQLHEENKDQLATEESVIEQETFVIMKEQTPEATEALVEQKVMKDDQDQLTDVEAVTGAKVEAISKETFSQKDESPFTSPEVIVEPKSLVSLTEQSQTLTVSQPKEEAQRVADTSQDGEVKFDVVETCPESRAKEGNETEPTKIEIMLETDHMITLEEQQSATTQTLAETWAAEDKTVKEEEAGKETEIEEKPTQETEGEKEKSPLISGDPMAEKDTVFHLEEEPSAATVVLHKTVEVAETAQFCQEEPVQETKAEITSTQTNSEYEGQFFAREVIIEKGPQITSEDKPSEAAAGLAEQTDINKATRSIEEAVREIQVTETVTSDPLEEDTTQDTPKSMIVPEETVILEQAMHKIPKTASALQAEEVADSQEAPGIPGLLQDCKERKTEDIEIADRDITVMAETAGPWKQEFQEPTEFPLVQKTDTQAEKEEAFNEELSSDVKIELVQATEREYEPPHHEQDQVHKQQSASQTEAEESLEGEEPQVVKEDAMVENKFVAPEALQGGVLEVTKDRFTVEQESAVTTEEDSTTDNEVQLIAAETSHTERVLYFKQEQLIEGEIVAKTKGGHFQDVNIAVQADSVDPLMQELMQECKDPTGTHPAQEGDGLQTEQPNTPSEGLVAEGKADSVSLAEMAVPVTKRAALQEDDIAASDQCLQEIAQIHASKEELLEEKTEFAEVETVTQEEQSMESAKVSEDEQLTLEPEPHQPKQAGVHESQCAPEIVPEAILEGGTTLALDKDTTVENNLLAQDSLQREKLSAIEVSFTKEAEPAVQVHEGTEVQLTGGDLGYKETVPLLEEQPLIDMQHIAERDTEWNHLAAEDVDVHQVEMAAIIQPDSQGAPETLVKPQEHTDTKRDAHDETTDVGDPVTAEPVASLKELQESTGYLLSKHEDDTQTEHSEVFHKELQAEVYAESVSLKKKAAQVTREEIVDQGSGMDESDQNLQESDQVHSPMQVLQEEVFVQIHALPDVLSGKEIVEVEAEIKAEPVLETDQAAEDKQSTLKPESPQHKQAEIQETRDPEASFEKSEKTWIAEELLTPDDGIAVVEESPTHFKQDLQEPSESPHSHEEEDAQTEQPGASHENLIGKIEDKLVSLQQVESKQRSEEIAKMHTEPEGSSEDEKNQVSVEDTMAENEHVEPDTLQREELDDIEERFPKKTQQKLAREGDWPANTQIQRTVAEAGTTEPVLLMEEESWIDVGATAGLEGEQKKHVAEDDATLPRETATTTQTHSQEAPKMLEEEPWIDEEAKADTQGEEKNQIAEDAAVLSREIAAIIHPGIQQAPEILVHTQEHTYTKTYQDPITNDEDIPVIAEPVAPLKEELQQSTEYLLSTQTKESEAFHEDLQAEVDTESLSLRQEAAQATERGCHIDASEQDLEKNARIHATMEVLQKEIFAQVHTLPEVLPERKMEVVEDEAETQAELSLDTEQPDEVKQFSLEPEIPQHKEAEVQETEEPEASLEKCEKTQVADKELITEEDIAAVEESAAQFKQDLQEPSEYPLTQKEDITQTEHPEASHKGLVGEIEAKSVSLQEEADQFCEIEPPLQGGNQAASKQDSEEIVKINTEPEASLKGEKTQVSVEDTMVENKHVARDAPQREELDDMEENFPKETEQRVTIEEDWPAGTEVPLAVAEAGAGESVPLLKEEQLTDVETTAEAQEEQKNQVAADDLILPVEITTTTKTGSQEASKMLEEESWIDTEAKGVAQGERKNQVAEDEAGLSRGIPAIILPGIQEAPEIQVNLQEQTETKKDQEPIIHDEDTPVIAESVTPIKEELQESTGYFLSKVEDNMQAEQSQAFHEGSQAEVYTETVPLRQLIAQPIERGSLDQERNKDTSEQDLEKSAQIYETMEVLQEEVFNQVHAPPEVLLEKRMKAVEIEAETQAEPSLETGQAADTQFALEPEPPQHKQAEVQETKEPEASFEKDEKLQVVDEVTNEDIADMEESLAQFKQGLQESKSPLTQEEDNTQTEQPEPSYEDLLGEIEADPVSLQNEAAHVSGIEAPFQEGKQVASMPDLKEIAQTHTELEASLEDEKTEASEEDTMVEYEHLPREALPCEEVDNIKERFPEETGMMVEGDWPAGAQIQLTVVAEAGTSEPLPLMEEEKLTDVEAAADTQREQKNHVVEDDATLSKETAFTVQTDTQEAPETWEEEPCTDVEAEADTQGEVKSHVAVDEAVLSREFADIIQPGLQEAPEISLYPQEHTDTKTDQEVMINDNISVIAKSGAPLKEELQKSTEYLLSKWDNDTQTEQSEAFHEDMPPEVYDELPSLQQEVTQTTGKGRIDQESDVEASEQDLEKSAEIHATIEIFQEEGFTQIHAPSEVPLERKMEVVEDEAGTQAETLLEVDQVPEDKQSTLEPEPSQHQKDQDLETQFTAEKEPEASIENGKKTQVIDEVLNPDEDIAVMEELGTHFKQDLQGPSESPLTQEEDIAQTEQSEASHEDMLAEIEGESVSLQEEAAQVSEIKPTLQGGNEVAFKQDLEQMVQIHAEPEASSEGEETPVSVEDTMVEGEHVAPDALQCVELNDLEDIFPKETEKGVKTEDKSVLSTEMIATIQSGTEKAPEILVHPQKQTDTKTGEKLITTDVGIAVMEESTTEFKQNLQTPSESHPTQENDDGQTEQLAFFQQDSLAEIEAHSFSLRQEADQFSENEGALKEGDEVTSEQLDEMVHIHAEKEVLLNEKTEVTEVNATQREPTLKTSQAAEVEQFPYDPESPQHEQADSAPDLEPEAILEINERTLVADENAIVENKLAAQDALQREELNIGEVTFTDEREPPITIEEDKPVGTETYLTADEAYHTEAVQLSEENQLIELQPVAHGEGQQWHAKDETVLPAEMEETSQKAPKTPVDAKEDMDVEGHKEVIVADVGIPVLAESAAPFEEELQDATQSHLTQEQDNTQREQSQSFYEDLLADVHAEPISSRQDAAQVKGGPIFQGSSIEAPEQDLEKLAQMHVPTEVLTGERIEITDVDALIQEEPSLEATQAAEDKQFAQVREMKYAPRTGLDATLEGEKTPANVQDASVEIKFGAPDTLQHEELNDIEDRTTKETEPAVTIEKDWPQSIEIQINGAEAGHTEPTPSLEEATLIDAEIKAETQREQHQVAEDKTVLLAMLETVQPGSEEDPENLIIPREHTDTKTGEELTITDMGNKVKAESAAPPTQDLQDPSESQLTQQKDHSQTGHPEAFQEYLLVETEAHSPSVRQEAAEDSKTGHALKEGDGVTHEEGLDEMAHKHAEMDVLSEEKAGKADLEDITHEEPSMETNVAADIQQFSHEPEASLETGENTLAAAEDAMVENKLASQDSLQCEELTVSKVTFTDQTEPPVTVEQERPEGTETHLTAEETDHVDDILLLEEKQSIEAEPIAEIHGEGQQWITDDEAMLPAENEEISVSVPEKAPEILLDLLEQTDTKAYKEQLIPDMGIPVLAESEEQFQQELQQLTQSQLTQEQDNIQTPESQSFYEDRLADVAAESDSLRQDAAQATERGPAVQGSSIVAPEQDFDKIAQIHAATEALQNEQIVIAEFEALTREEPSHEKNQAAEDEQFALDSETSQQKQAEFQETWCAPATGSEASFKKSEKNQDDVKDALVEDELGAPYALRREELDSIEGRTARETEQAVTVEEDLPASTETQLTVVEADHTQQLLLLKEMPLINVEPKEETQEKETQQVAEDKSVLTEMAATKQPGSEEAPETLGHAKEHTEIKADEEVVITDVDFAVMTESAAPFEQNLHDPSALYLTQEKDQSQKEQPEEFQENLQAEIGSSSLSLGKEATQVSEDNEVTSEQGLDEMAHTDVLSEAKIEEAEVEDKEPSIETNQTGEVQEFCLKQEPPQHKQADSAPDLEQEAELEVGEKTPVADEGAIIENIIVAQDGVTCEEMNSSEVRFPSETEPAVTIERGWETSAETLLNAGDTSHKEAVPLLEEDQMTELECTAETEGEGQHHYGEDQTMLQTETAAALQSDSQDRENIAQIDTAREVLPEEKVEVSVDEAKTQMGEDCPAVTAEGGHKEPVPLLQGQPLIDIDGMDEAVLLTEMEEQPVEAILEKQTEDQPPVPVDEEVLLIKMAASLQSNSQEAPEILVNPQEHTEIKANEKLKFAEVDAAVMAESAAPFKQDLQDSCESHLIQEKNDTQKVQPEDWQELSIAEIKAPLVSLQHEAAQVSETEPSLPEGNVVASEQYLDEITNAHAELEALSEEKIEIAEVEDIGQRELELNEAGEDKQFALEPEPPQPEPGESATKLESEASLEVGAKTLDSVKNAVVENNLEAQDAVQHEVQDIVEGGFSKEIELPVMTEEDWPLGTKSKLTAGKSGQVEAVPSFKEEQLIEVEPVVETQGEGQLLIAQDETVTQIEMAATLQPESQEAHAIQVNPQEHTDVQTGKEIINTDVEILVMAEPAATSKKELQETLESNFTQEGDTQTEQPQSFYQDLQSEVEVKLVLLKEEAAEVTKRGSFIQESSIVESEKGLEEIAQINAAMEVLPEEDIKVEFTNQEETSQQIIQAGEYKQPALESETLQHEQADSANETEPEASLEVREKTPAADEHALVEDKLAAPDALQCEELKTTEVRFIDETEAESKIEEDLSRGTETSFTAEVEEQSVEVGPIVETHEEPQSLVPDNEDVLKTEMGSTIQPDKQEAPEIKFNQVEHSHARTDGKVMIADVAISIMPESTAAFRQELQSTSEIHFTQEEEDTQTEQPEPLNEDLLAQVEADSVSLRETAIQVSETEPVLQGGNIKASEQDSEEIAHPHAKPEVLSEEEIEAAEVAITQQELSIETYLATQDEQFVHEVESAPETQPEIRLEVGEKAPVSQEDTIIENKMVAPGALQCEEQSIVEVSFADETGPAETIGEHWPAGTDIQLTAGEAGHTEPALLLKEVLSAQGEGKKRVPEDISVLPTEMAASSQEAFKIKVHAPGLTDTRTDKELIIPDREFAIMTESAAPCKQDFQDPVESHHTQEEDNQTEQQEDFNKELLAEVEADSDTLQQEAAKISETEPTPQGGDIVESVQDIQEVAQRNDATKVLQDKEIEVAHIVASEQELEEVAQRNAATNVLQEEEIDFAEVEAITQREPSPETDQAAEDKQIAFESDLPHVTQVEACEVLRALELEDPRESHLTQEKDDTQAEQPGAFHKDFLAKVEAESDTLKQEAAEISETEPTLQGGGIVASEQESEEVARRNAATKVLQEEEIEVAEVEAITQREPSPETDQSAEDKQIALESDLPQVTQVEAHEALRALELKDPSESRLSQEKDDTQAEQPEAFQEALLAEVEAESDTLKQEAEKISETKPTLQGGDIVESEQELEEVAQRNAATKILQEEEIEVAHIVASEQELEEVTQRNAATKVLQEEEMEVAEVAAITQQELSPETDRAAEDKQIALESDLPQVTQVEAYEALRALELKDPSESCLTQENDDTQAEQTGSFHEALLAEVEAESVPPRQHAAQVAETGDAIPGKDVAGPEQDFQDNAKLYAELEALPEEKIEVAEAADLTEGEPSMEIHQAAEGRQLFLEPELPQHKQTEVHETQCAPGELKEGIEESQKPQVAEDAIVVAIDALQTEELNFIEVSFTNQSEPAVIIEEHWPLAEVEAQSVPLRQHAAQAVETGDVIPEEDIVKPEQDFQDNAKLYAKLEAPPEEKIEVAEAADITQGKPSMEINQAAEDRQLSLEPELPRHKQAEVHETQCATGTELKEGIEEREIPQVAEDAIVVATDVLQTEELNFIEVSFTGESEPPMMIEEDWPAASETQPTAGEPRDAELVPLSQKEPLTEVESIAETLGNGQHWDAEDETGLTEIASSSHLESGEAPEVLEKQQSYTDTRIAEEVMITDVDIAIMEESVAPFKQDLKKPTESPQRQEFDDIQTDHPEALPEDLQDEKQSVQQTELDLSSKVENTEEGIIIETTPVVTNEEDRPGEGEVQLTPREAGNIEPVTLLEEKQLTEVQPIAELQEEMQHLAGENEGVIQAQDAATLQPETQEAPHILVHPQECEDGSTEEVRSPDIDPHVEQESAEPMRIESQGPPESHLTEEAAHTQTEQTEAFIKDLLSEVDPESDSPRQESVQVTETGVTSPQEDISQIHASPGDLPEERIEVAVETNEAAQEKLFALEPGLPEHKQAKVQESSAPKRELELGLEAEETSVADEDAIAKNKLVAPDAMHCEEQNMIEFSSAVEPESSVTNGEDWPADPEAQRGGEGGHTELALFLEEEQYPEILVHSHEHQGGNTNGEVKITDVSLKEPSEIGSALDVPQCLDDNIIKAIAATASEQEGTVEVDYPAVTGTNSNEEETAQTESLPVFEEGRQIQVEAAKDLKEGEESPVVDSEHVPTESAATIMVGLEEKRFSLESEAFQDEEAEVNKNTYALETTRVAEEIDSATVSKDSCAASEVELGEKIASTGLPEALQQNCPAEITDLEGGAQQNSPVLEAPLATGALQERAALAEVQTAFEASQTKLKETLDEDSLTETEDAKSGDFEAPLEPRLVEIPDHLIGEEVQSKSAPTIITMPDLIDFSEQNGVQVVSEQADSTCRGIPTFQESTDSFEGREESMMLPSDLIEALSGPTNFTQGSISSGQQPEEPGPDSTEFPIISQEMLQEALQTTVSTSVQSQHESSCAEAKKATYFQEEGILARTTEDPVKSSMQGTFMPHAPILQEFIEVSATGPSQESELPASS